MSSDTSREVLREEIDNLQQERTLYALRIAALLRRPECKDEVDGYMSLIDNINLAVLRLAKTLDEQADDGSLSIAA